MNAARYLRFRHASPMFEQTERDARLIWSVNEYRSSGGKRLEISNMRIAASAAW